MSASAVCRVLVPSFLLDETISSKTNSTNHMFSGTLRDRLPRLDQPKWVFPYFT